MAGACRSALKVEAGELRTAPGHHRRLGLWARQLPCAQVCTAGTGIVRMRGERRERSGAEGGEEAEGGERRERSGGRGAEENLSL
eukprot:760499-Hanusia_phi.AAC.8